MVNTFQDTDPSFVYGPSDSTWTTNPERLGTFSGGSGQYVILYHHDQTPNIIWDSATNASGASITYAFKVSHTKFCTGYVIELDQG